MVEVKARLALSSLLDAPCVFCDYDGEGYYQIRTHDSSCPWHTAGGTSVRVQLLPGIIRGMSTRLKDFGELVTLLRREIVEIDKRYPDGRK